MLYHEFTVENKVYKLRLNTRNIISLESALGCNPLAIFGNGDTIPTVTTMVQILWASMQQLNHGITLDAAYDVFDAWINEGHNMTEFIQVIIEIYKVSGMMKAEQPEKN